MADKTSANIRITAQLREKISRLILNGDYVTESEFIRAAIREKLKRELEE